MRLCGIELSGDEARLVVLEKRNEDLIVVPCSSPKIILQDDESSKHMHSLYNDLANLVASYGINILAVKKRRKKGKFAGGAVSFKIEAVIQLIPDCIIQLVDSATISAYIKRNPLSLPSGLHNYQQVAFDVARTALGQAQI